MMIACAAMLPGLAVAGIKVSRAATVEKIRSVTDGDTFRLESGERIRIADIDAPETRKWQAGCQAERKLGEAAKSRLSAMIGGKTVQVARVGRSYNRIVARVRFRGRDLATSLVARGDAAWWLRGNPKPLWCGRR